MSGPDREAVRALAAAYVLGSLDQEEAAAFEAMLRASPDLAGEVAEYREVAALLARGAPAAQPDAALRARVLARVATERALVSGGPTRPPWRWATGLAWAAAVIGIVAAALLGLEARSRGRESAALRAALDSVADSLAARDRVLAALLAPATVSFTLSGEPELQRPSIAMFWNRDQNVWALHATGLAPAPAGRTYQLWFLRGAEAIPSSTFEPTAEGRAVVIGTGPVAPGTVTATAVTREPAGGSPQPTSTPILVGPVPEG